MTIHKEVMTDSRDFSDALPKEMQAHHYPILYQVEESHWWYVGRRRLLESFVADIRAALNKSKLRILDVGCGTRANLKMLARYGNQRGLEDVRQGAAESLPYGDNTFDLVTALDVLEHLDDDRAGLAEIRRVLLPNGRALLFVPAFMFLWGVQDEVSNHRRRYTRRELSRVVAAAGLEVERASYANFTFFFPVLLVRWIMRLLKLRAATEYGINLPLMNKIFANLFAAERFLLKRAGFPFGVSVLCVARKAS
ncbi:MAG: class I SAM-dependent methyltransferase [Acidobacteria bacterium]|nr:MAG: class I SAM-dependent methyltransferase [Acidobacteriota bacterium]